MTFPTLPNPSTSSKHPSVKAEYHWLEVNRVFFCDVKPRTVDQDAVAQLVFNALAGPLAAFFKIYQLEIRSKNGHVKRVRYLLRPSEAVCPIFVERFYIPLDTVDRQEKIWGIFKPWSKRWECPACHEKCQSGVINMCAHATELPVVHGMSSA